jgi:hypothetical protein
LNLTRAASSPLLPLRKNGLHTPLLAACGLATMPAQRWSLKRRQSARRWRVREHGIGAGQGHFRDFTRLEGHRIKNRPPTWTGPMGPASTRRKEAVEALKHAVQMLSKGYQDVIILDGDGKAHSPAEFRQLYLDRS